LAALNTDPCGRVGLLPNQLQSSTIGAVTDLPNTRVYLVRHCDVRNPDGVLYGHLPDFGLSHRGLAQAHALSKFFEDKPIRRVYTSPLERARQTAEIIAKDLSGIPTETCDGLVEAKFGHYLQGIRPREVPLRRPLWFVHMIWPGLLPNDESVGEMAERVRRPILRLLDEFPGEGGVCVSHGDPIQAFWVAAEDRPPYALHRLQCRKGGMLELDYEGTRLVRLTYRSPESIGAPEPVPATDAGNL
jgi:broad specificity phosphatase PhoE